VQMMMVTMTFTWHVAAVVVFQFFLAVLIYRRTKRRWNGRDVKSNGGLANRNGGVFDDLAYTRLALDEDTEDDLDSEVARFSRTNKADNDSVEDLNLSLK